MTEIIYVIDLQDIQAYTHTSGEFPYPIIADVDRSIAKTLGMIDPDEMDTQGMPLTCRAVSNQHTVSFYLPFCSCHCPTTTNTTTAAAAGASSCILLSLSSKPSCLSCLMIDSFRLLKVTAVCCRNLFLSSVCHLFA